MTSETQERRTERLGVACTPYEDRAAKAVAIFDNVEDGVSGLLRIKSLTEVLARYEEIQAAARATESAA